LCIALYALDKFTTYLQTLLVLPDLWVTVISNEEP